MKRILLILLGVTFYVIGSAQNIVTTNPQKKSVVLEELTGIHCTFCPEGHAIAKDIKAVDDSRVILVNVHAGGYANPSAGEPDYRTAEGTILDRALAPTGYPNGTVNRRMYAGSRSYGRGTWAPYSAEVLTETSTVNVGATTSYDAATRELTVTSEAYYTEDSEVGTNRLIIALLQDNILGPQVGASRNPDDVVGGLYRHSHMLRHFIHGAYGVEITETSAGTVFEDIVTYVIPEEINGVPVVIDDCHVAVYVAHNNFDVQQGVGLGLNDIDDGNNAQIYLDYNGFDYTAVNSTSEGNASFSSQLLPYIEGDAGYDISITSAAPADWTFELSVTDLVLTTSETVILVGGSAEDFDFTVTPGSSGVGSYTISVAPTGSTEGTISFTLEVVHDCTDLIVNSESTRGDGVNATSESWSSFYTTAFADQEIEKSGMISPATYMALANNSDLENIQNLYFNLGWTFPAYTDDLVSALIPFMDAGGNVFMAGQDVAWDISENGGSAMANNFMNNYLNVSYVSDGGTANNPVTANPDGIFADIENFRLLDFYGGTPANFYPDQITPINGAIAAFTYVPLASKVGAAYSDNGTNRVVYLGFGLEMVEGQEARAAIMQRVYEFFNGIVDNEEPLSIGTLDVYPNPLVGNVLSIENNTQNAEIQVELVNSVGQIVFNATTSVTGVNSFDVNLAEGLYFLNYTLNDIKQVKAVVIK